jgi:dienelactone hydrolase
MLYRPQGRGSFPAILLNHGSGRTPEDLKRLGSYEKNPAILGPVFARHGYVFLYLFRRGVGLSTDQGANAIDLMTSESAAHGQEARNALQMKLLENREMDDALSALKFLWALPYVDAKDVAVIGHSFGGSLTVLLAEREPNLRAVVIFSGAGYSFDRSPELRTRLLAAMDHIAAPVFFIHAENDYSLSSGKELERPPRATRQAASLEDLSPHWPHPGRWPRLPPSRRKHLGARRLRLPRRKHAQVNLPGMDGTQEVIHVLDKRGNRPSKVLLHISGNPTNQASGRESVNTTAFSRSAYWVAVE